MKDCQQNYQFVSLFFLLFSASKAKIEFNKRLTLIPSESWIQCGSFLDLCYSARSIVVKIDPTGLPPGVHTAKYVNQSSQIKDLGVSKFSDFVYF